MNQNEQKQLELEQLWNNNKVGKLVSYIVNTLPWIESFYEQHKIYPKTLWHRLFTFLLIYKRAQVTVLVGMFHKRYEDVSYILKFLQYAEQNNVLVWDDSNKEYYLNCLQLSDEVQRNIDLWQYPMPIISEPRKVRNNFDSPYLMIQHENVVLSGIQGNEDVNLEHINRLNSVKYSLNTDVAINCENVWKPHKSPLEVVIHNLKRYMTNCVKALSKIFDYGNEFHFSWRYDRRGRSYPQGYYLNPQGTDYNKYCLEFANKEICK